MRLAGYAALFDKVDGARDTIRRGAFAASLAARKDPLPLFWQHRPDQQIGWVEQAREDDRGLRVTAQIDNPDGKAAAMLSERATVSASVIALAHFAMTTAAGCWKRSIFSKSASSPIRCNMKRGCI